MYCMVCGNPLETRSVMCPRCGTAVTPPGPSPDTARSCFTLPPTQVLGSGARPAEPPAWGGQGTGGGAASPQPGTGGYGSWGAAQTPPPAGSGSWGNQNPPPARSGSWGAQNPPPANWGSPGREAGWNAPGGGGSFQPADLLQQFQPQRSALHQRSGLPPAVLFVTALVAVILISLGVKAMRAGNGGASPSPSISSPTAPGPVATGPGGVATVPQAPPSSTTPATVPTDTPTPTLTETPSPTLSQAPTEMTDPVAVLRQLTQIEFDWAKANFSGDKSTLATILADDFSCVSQGRRLTKASFIATTARDAALLRWLMSNVRLCSLQGDHAVVTGELRAFYPLAEHKYVFTDAFVYRDSRWQATGTVTVKVY